MKRLTLALIGCLALPAALADSVYKTRDADGTIRYSDRPPAGAVLLDVIPLPAPRSEEEQAAQREAAEQRRQHRLETTERLREDRLAREAARTPPPPAPPAAPPPVVIVERNVRATPWLVPWSPLHPHHRPPYNRPPHHRPPAQRPEAPEREAPQQRRGVDERQFHVPLRRIDP